MLKWLVLPVVVFAYLAATVSASAPRDRDHDRLPDRWERKHQLSTSAPSGRLDPDGDHLRNRRELRLRTHPRRADTDRDRLRDGAEVRRFHTNPRKRDTDGDSFSDRCELRKGTNPRKRSSRPKRRCSNSPDAPRNPAPTPPGGGSPNPSGGTPNESNTGVPPGTVLTPSGSMTITTAGAVISAREITGSVTVDAPNVTIRNSRIVSNDFMAIRSNSTGLVVEDSEILDGPDTGQNNCHNGIGFGGYTARRVEIVGCENAADVGENNVVFVDNYVHDLDTDGPSYVWGNTPHTDGIQGNGSNVTISRNWIDPTPGDDGNAVIFAPGGSNNYVIADNYLDGRGTNYTIYAPRESGRSGNKINGNRMLRARYGYTACARVGVTVNEFNGNRDAGTGAAIAPDDGAGGSCSN
jgi:hypothetical protein